MKQFFMSFLGAVAGIWVSILLLSVLSIVALVAMALSSGTETGNINIKSHSILHVDLSGEITDRATPIDFMKEIYGASEGSIALNDLISSIKSAANDKDIEGLYLELNGSSAGLAQRQAIIAAINEFKQTGKWVYAYSDNITQGDYFVACAADSIFLNPIGMVDIHGLAATTMYFKDLLDKIGVDVQVVKVGTYKSAVEPFILNDISEANREQQLHYLGNIWNQVCNTISTGRNVSIQQVNEWADGYTYTMPIDYYLENKIVDRAVYRREMKDILATKTDCEEPRLVGFNDYYAVKGKLDKSVGKKEIAVLYAVGDITESGEGGIASDALVPQILDLMDDDDIQGLILRVNSGGGSAFASEQIWEALEQFKAVTGKPFYVSMGDYAASGGYYISCGADRIYAEPLTLTGSIGIFGLIPNAQKLLNDKIGINTSTVATNKGSLPSFTEPMTPAQEAAMQSYVNRGYELFVSRCAEGRNVPVDSIKAIAEGRVWDGTSAAQLGLVDKLGGLDMAIAEMAADLEISDDYYVKEYPKVKFKWWEELFEISKSVKAMVMKNELGETMKYYNTIKDLNEIDHIQCRMDFVEIK